MNKRQKKKKIKQTLLTFKPNQLFLLEFNMDDFFDVKEVQQIYELYSKVLPPCVSFIITPKFNKKIFNSKEEAYTHIKILKEIIDKEYNNETTGDCVCDISY